MCRARVESNVPRLFLAKSKSESRIRVSILRLEILFTTERNTRDDHPPAISRRVRWPVGHVEKKSRSQSIWSSQPSIMERAAIRLCASGLAQQASQSSWHRGAALLFDRGSRSILRRSNSTAIGFDTFVGGRASISFY